MTLMRSVCTAFVVFALASPALAQNPATAATKAQFGMISGVLNRTAEKIPENLYTFKATPEVRSIAQLIGHIADAQFMMCAAAVGEKPAQSGIEKSMTDQGRAEQGAGRLVGLLQQGDRRVDRPEGDGDRQVLHWRHARVCRCSASTSPTATSTTATSSPTCASTRSCRRRAKRAAWTEPGWGLGAGGWGLSATHHARAPGRPDAGVARRWSLLSALLSQGCAPVYWLGAKLLYDKAPPPPTVQLGGVLRSRGARRRRSGSSTSTCRAVATTRSSSSCTAAAGRGAIARRASAAPTSTATSAASSPAAGIGAAVIGYRLVWPLDWQSQVGDVARAVAWVQAPCRGARRPAGSDLPDGTLRRRAAGGARRHRSRCGWPRSAAAWPASAAWWR